MKKAFVAFVLCALAFGAQAARAETGLGIGVIVGEPTGVSIKKWIGETRAVDFAAAWSFSGEGSFQIHADYLIHNFSLLKLEGLKGRLPVYFGVGGRIKLKGANEGKEQNNEDDSVGIRVPFGIAYIFADSPVDVFAEIVPVLDVVPDTKLHVNAAIGARFYFR